MSQLEIFPNVRFEVEAESEELRAIDRLREVCEGLHLEAVLVVVDKERIVVAKWNIVETLLLKIDKVSFWDSLLLS